MLTERTHVAHITKLSIPNNICEAYVLDIITNHILSKDGILYMHRRYLVNKSYAANQ